MASSLYRCGKLSLMVSAGTGSSAGEDLCSLGDVLAELSNVFIVDVIDAVDAERADLLAGLLGEARSVVFSFHL